MEHYEGEILDLSVSSKYVNITKFQPIISSENMSKKKEGLGWTAYVPNLSPGTSLAIAAYVNSTITADEGSFEKMSLLANSPLVYATATYDQGTAVGSNFEGNPIFIGGLIFHDLISGSIPSTYVSMIAASILSVVAFGVAMRYKKIKEIRERRALDKRATTMLGEITAVKEELEKNPASKKYFPYRLPKGDEGSMRQIYDNLEDYSLVKSFYDSLDKRLDWFSGLPHYTDEIENLNKECLKKANCVLSLGTWVRYREPRKIKLDLLFALPAVVISSIFIYFSGELLPAYLFDNWLRPILDNFVNSTGFSPISGWLYWNVLMSVSLFLIVVISFTMRTIIAYLLAKAIIKRFQSSPPLSEQRKIIRFSKSELTQMFFFSATIMGFPILMLNQTLESVSLFGNSLFILLFILDMGRMYVLTIYVPNAILMKRSRRLFLKVLFIPIAGFILYYSTIFDELSTFWKQ